MLSNERVLFKRRKILDKNGIYHHNIKGMHAIGTHFFCWILGWILLGPKLELGWVSQTRALDLVCLLLLAWLLLGLDFPFSDLLLSRKCEVSLLKNLSVIVL